MHNSDDIQIKNVTTLSEQINNMNMVASAKMRDYKHQNRSTPVESIVKIFKRHSRIAISSQEEQKIRNVINSAIHKKKRIPIGFTWGCSGMALSEMKFRETINYPRKGDLWCLWWFHILNEKIKVHHEPGIDLIIGDEIPHFHALGWPYRDVIRRHEIMKTIAEQHFDFIKIIAIPDYTVLLEDTEIKPPSMEEILSIATSLPENNIPREVFDILHSARNWSWIRNQISNEIWEEAKWIITKANKISVLRKKHNLLGSFFKNSDYIDAALTEKERFCPNPWNQTSPQHGGTILTSSINDGRYSITIEPEYRILEKCDEYTAIMINTSEFKHFTDQPIKELWYTFYWKHN